MKHMLTLSAMVLGSALIGFSPASAVPPDVMTIVQQMKEIFEPVRSRTQKVVISTTTPQGEEVQWVAGQAREQLADGKRTLLVMLEPQDMRGTALLLGEREGQPDIMWWYPPELRRVRAIVPVESHQRFLDTDFTYADLGFIDRRGGTYRLLGEEEHAGVRAYKIELAPQEQWYYSRIITWVAADSFVPLQRDFYDRAGRLWRTTLFEKITIIDGVPTPLLMRMRDVQAGTSTEFRVSEVRYDVDIPDALFQPGGLPQVVNFPLWQAYSPRVAQSQEAAGVTEPATVAKTLADSERPQ